MLHKNFTDFLMLGYGENNKHDKIKIQIKDEIIPNDYDRNLNYVNWTDTDAGFNFPALHRGETFSDATNSVEPNATATSGLIPAYSVHDLSAGYTYKKKYSLKSGVNNLTKANYFTGRAGGYRGPGIMRADGRIFYLTFGVKF